MDLGRQFPRKSCGDANLRQLFVLRNVTVGGELLVVLGAIWGLNLVLPVLPISMLLLAMLGLNISTWICLRGGRVVADWELFAQLILDVFAFSMLMYLTGGATNPFAWFYLLPLVISATLLSPGYTRIMAILTVACYTVLTRFYLPLPLPNGGAMEAMQGGGFPLHVFGMWFGFVLSAGLIAHFVVGMSQSLKIREARLAEAREQALRDEGLVELGMLAAGAAHELGTPLGTMAIISGELQHTHGVGEAPEVHRAASLLLTQIERCKDALSSISASAGVARADAGASAQTVAYLDQLMEKWRGSRLGVKVKYHHQQENSPGYILSDRLLSQALENILNNAADASPEAVKVDARQQSGQWLLEISDRGCGLGQSAGEAVISGKEHGLGIGLLLAYGSIRRLGGEVSHHLRVGGGTCTRISLPLIESPAVCS